MQISLYLLCFLQLGKLKNAKWLIFTVLFATRRAKKCTIAYIYCAFCNYYRQQMQINIFAVFFAIWLALCPYFGVIWPQGCARVNRAWFLSERAHGVPMVSVSHGSWCPPGGKTAEFGELKNAKYLIFIVFFAITRAKKCKLAYICYFLQFGELKVQNYLYCCAFCNPES